MTRPAGNRRIVGPRRFSRFVPGLAFSLGCTLLAGCTGAPDSRVPAVSGASPRDTTAAPARAVPTGQPGSADATDAAAASAIRAAVDAFDATASGPVDAQQRVLSSLLDPGQRDAQLRCPAATTTLELRPVYADLAAAPEWKPAAGTATGTVYSLPTLIRIHRDGRITGTDVADLHPSVSAGRAFLPALCIG